MLYACVVQDVVLPSRSYQDPCDQVWCQPNTPCFDVSSTFCACTKQDAVLPSQLSLDLCVLCSLDPQTWRILSAFCSNFVHPVSILNSWWSVNWLHIRCHKWTRTNCSENTLSCNDGWMGLRPEWPWRGRILVLMDQYNIEIFSCCLRLLPFCSSTFRQTNVEIAQKRSEDNL